MMPVSQVTTSNMQMSVVAKWCESQQGLQGVSRVSHSDKNRRQVRSFKVVEL